MPLLMCPNCNSSMQELNRSDVTFDMCPSCRGVWLDRGELEKIIEGSRVSAPAPQAAPQNYQGQTPQPQQQQRYRDDDDDDDRRRYSQDQHRGQQQGYNQHRKKRGGFDIFDIFD